MSKFATLLVAGLFIAGNAAAQGTTTPAKPTASPAPAAAPAATPAPAPAASATPAKPTPAADTAKKDTGAKGETKSDTKGAMDKKPAPDTGKK